MAVIEVNHLQKRYGDLVAVRDVSFAVEAGEIFGVLGPNGAGKTTTVRMLCTLLPITDGAARVAGVDVRADPGEVRRRAKARLSEAHSQTLSFSDASAKQLRG